MTRTVAALMRERRRIRGYNTDMAGRELGMSGRSIECIEQGRRRADDRLTEIALRALIREAQERKTP